MVLKTQRFTSNIAEGSLFSCRGLNNGPDRTRFGISKPDPVGCYPDDNNYYVSLANEALILHAESIIKLRKTSIDKSEAVDELNLEIATLRDTITNNNVVMETLKEDATINNIVSTLVAIVPLFIPYGSVTATDNVVLSYVGVSLVVIVIMSLRDGLDL